MRTCCQDDLAFHYRPGIGGETLFSIIEIKTGLAADAAEKVGFYIGHEVLRRTQAIFFINIEQFTDPLDHAISFQTIKRSSGCGEIGIAEGVAHRPDGRYMRKNELLVF